MGSVTVLILFHNKCDSTGTCGVLELLQGLICKEVNRQLDLHE